MLLCMAVYSQSSCSCLNVPNVARPQTRPNKNVGLIHQVPTVSHLKRHQSLPGWVSNFLLICFPLCSLCSALCKRNVEERSIMHKMKLMFFRGESLRAPNAFCQSERTGFRHKKKPLPTLHGCAHCQPITPTRCSSVTTWQLCPQLHSWNACICMCLCTTFKQ